MSNLTAPWIEGMSAQPLPDEGAHSRKTILIGTDTYPPDVNGAAMFTHRLASALARRGNEVHVVCASDSGPASQHMMDGVTVHRLRSVPAVVYPSLRFVMPGTVAGPIERIIAAVEPDVMHVQSHFGVGRACLKAARAARLPVVATNHFMAEPLTRHFAVPQAWRDLAAKWAWADAARVFAQADHVTTPTPLAAEVFAKRGFRGDVEAVSCGIDLSRFRESASTPQQTRACFGVPDKPTIVFVGRLDEEKGIHHTIEALSRLRHHVDAQLVVAGVGPQRDELERMATELGVADDVHLLGYVTEEELPHVYHLGTVFAIPSVAELQSIVTLEAMASGLPIVGADAVALPHLIREDCNGYLVEPGDAAALGDRLRTVLESESLQRAMGATSRAMAVKHDQVRSLERFESIYAALAATALTR